MLVANILMFLILVSLLWRVGRLEDLVKEHAEAHAAVEQETHAAVEQETQSVLDQMDKLGTKEL
jgi:hypothetical protein